MLKEITLKWNIVSVARWAYFVYIGPMKVAIIAYDGISPFMLSTPMAVFGESFLTSGHLVNVCSSEPRFTASGGLNIEAPCSLKEARGADIVILPGWRDHEEAVPNSILDELGAAHDRGAIVVGLCLGAFGLAQSGILDGRRATTHWARCEVFSLRFPHVTVDKKAIFVDEGSVVTSAGIASGIDCCLHLLARISGTGEANRIARHLVVAPQRFGTQPQLIERSAAGTSADKRIEDLLDEIRADPTLAPSLDDLAARAGMSRRTLTRHIRARTGGSLGDWIRRLRLMRAQELMCAGIRGLSGIAVRSGFPDDHALRAAFKTELGVSPRQWLARQRCN
ncbi:GlxA family transcriptional regulator [Thioclava sp. GXIMD4215]|uniref:GlxA family transcriptional regulator n=1 Tax=Thioclava sp. GXIMD4215 TaxID=3131928 RepID=UPI00324D486F